MKKKLRRIWYNIRNYIRFFCPEWEAQMKKKAEKGKRNRHIVPFALRPWVFFSFTVNSIGIKSMSVAHNKFSLCHLFSVHHRPLFSYLLFRYASPFFFFPFFFFSHFIQQLGSAVSFLFLSHFFSPNYVCIYCCYRVALQCKCLICVSTYELASFFVPLVSLEPFCFGKKNTYYTFRRRADAVLTERSLEKTDLLSELKLLAVCVCVCVSGNHCGCYRGSLKKGTIIIHPGRE